MTTNYAVAPGEYLEEWIDDQGFSQQQTAELLGVSRKHVNEIVNGRASVTPETARRLERVSRIPADAWLRYEAAYRADLTRIADEENLARHVDDIDATAATYLRSLGATTATRANPGRLVSDLLAFERGRTYNYDETELRAALPDLRTRSARPDQTMLRDIAGLLADVGVVFVVVEPPKSFPLLGMTRWIDKRVPVIQQTGRWGKDGFVVWTLFHELGHVLNDPRGEMHLEYKTEKRRTSAAERGANHFAFNTLFSESGMEPFRGLTRDGDIARAAKQVGISPGVAVHQMHRKRLLDYRFGNTLCVDLKDTFSE